MESFGKGAHMRLDDRLTSEFVSEMAIFVTAKTGIDEIPMVELMCNELTGVLRIPKNVGGRLNMVSPTITLTVPELRFSSEPEGYSTKALEDLKVFAIVNEDLILRCPTFDAAPDSSKFFDLHCFRSVKNLTEEERREIIARF